MMRFRLAIFMMIFLFSNICYGVGSDSKKVEIVGKAVSTHNVVVKEKSEIFQVMGVVMIGWIGIFLFLLKIQLDVKKLSKELEDE